MLPITPLIMDSSDLTDWTRTGAGESADPFVSDGLSAGEPLPVSSNSNYIMSIFSPFVLSERLYIKGLKISVHRNRPIAERREQ